MCLLADYLYLSARQEAPLTARVLIADTDAELRQRLYTRLLDLDIFSDCANNAADAMGQLDEHSYALIIADVGLPNGGIEQLVARIGRIERDRRPIVLVLAATAEAARALDVEIVQIVLRRPVNIPQLIDLVRSCLRNSAPATGQAEGDGGSPHDQPTS